MGVGSEVYGAYINGRKAVGIELKASYYRQAIKNLAEAKWNQTDEETDLFEDAKTGNELTDELMDPEENEEVTA
jgi:hypothetical protein